MKNNIKITNFIFALNPALINANLFLYLYLFFSHISLKSFKYSSLLYFPFNLPKYSGFNFIKFPNFIILYAQYKNVFDKQLADV